ncbi:pyrroline-5-carboxylate reductase [Faunimonas pinastri]|uniref:Pyrroline-5-carboxylate reductase n=2 Tax=Faunimonas pinastri TaxID=1855383 RepID=A0A1H9ASE3_9HYPH|nr:pyrroline-5-carboxylate reductase [Faunimonas pinastri]
MLERAEPLCLLGAGKMGSALLNGWLGWGFDPGAVTVVDPGLDAARRTEFTDRGITVVSSMEEAGTREFRAVLLAVKPQMMGNVLPSTGVIAGPETLVVSVAAGIRLDMLGAAFPRSAVVRAMPNTPAQVGMGMTVAIGNERVTSDFHALAGALLEAVGKVAWIEDESLMDAVTAVSGSGPAYVFLLAECLAEAGRKAGLPADLAETLANQTVAGAGVLLDGGAIPAATLRQNVTSPNGTTAAALSVLMADDGLQPLMDRAVEAARLRSIELG